MLYLSQILGRPILDAEGEKIAVIKDMIVRYGEADYPPMVGLVARYRRRNFFMSRKRISYLGESGANLVFDQHQASHDNQYSDGYWYLGRCKDLG